MWTYVCIPCHFTDEALLGLQAVIDLLIPGQNSRIKEPSVDLYGKLEMLFFGPDGM